MKVKIMIYYSQVLFSSVYLCALCGKYFVRFALDFTGKGLRNL